MVAVRGSCATMLRHGLCFFHVPLRELNFVPASPPPPPSLFQSTPPLRARASNRFFREKHQLRPPCSEPSGPGPWRSLISRDGHQDSSFFPIIRAYKSLANVLELGLTSTL